MPVGPPMALKGDGRLFEAETSRTIIYVSQRVASDSAFPFGHRDKLSITIDADNGRLIIERADEES